jgi:hypothetical protein
MKATEFRIGNIVYVKGKVDELSGIADNDYYSTGYGHGVWDDDIEPIPLTEEWLVKFGFLSDGDGFLKDLKHNELFIHLNHFNEVIFQIGYKDNWTMNMSIRCVHQLQNLYFALTGKELESTQIEKI